MRLPKEKKKLLLWALLCHITPIFFIYGSIVSLLTNNKSYWEDAAVFGWILMPFTLLLIYFYAQLIEFLYIKILKKEPSVIIVAGSTVMFFILVFNLIGLVPDHL